MLLWWQMIDFDEENLNQKLKDLRIANAERDTFRKAQDAGFKAINLQGYTINPEALIAIPEKIARAANIVGFEIKQKQLSVAATNPLDETTQKTLETLTQKGYQLQVYLTSNTSLKHAWVRYADIKHTSTTKKGVFDISAEDISQLEQKIHSIADIEQELTNINKINNSYRISATLELLFAGAMALGASDIHIEPTDTAVRVRYRLNGVLQDIINIDSYLYERLVSRLKLLSSMILNNKTEAQDGRFTFATREKEIEIRSSVIPGTGGESFVMRLLDPTVASFQLEKLNLNQPIRTLVEKEIKKPNGLIITTGPTGSGKTTALYAFLQQVHQPDKKIITIENPVEYKLNGIIQTQTTDDYTFASGLRAILRQDPEVIMIGEIRDYEVAETALNAAQTGHLVFSTLHTNSAVAGFARLIGLGIDPRSFGSSINMLLGQRLVRTLCPYCKQSYEPSVQERKLVETIITKHPHRDQVPPLTKLYRAGGCERCGHTGFQGRTGIYEAIAMDAAVEEAILSDPREHIILDAAAPQGIPSLVQDGIAKVLTGITSLIELERVVEIPHTETTISSDNNAEDDNFLSHVV